MRFFPESLANVVQPEALSRSVLRLVDSLSSMFNKGLTVKDNIDGFISTFTVEATQVWPVLVRNELSHPPAAVMIVQAKNVSQGSAPACLYGPAWYSSGDRIVVTGIGGLTAGQTYSITLLVLGG